jgi:hypothetical protein
MKLQALNERCDSGGTVDLQWPPAPDQLESLEVMPPRYERERSLSGEHCFAVRLKVRRPYVRRIGTTRHGGTTQALN